MVEIVKNSILAGWIARALVVALSLVNSRLLIELVGIEGLAVQSILLSLATWFALLNFGIPSAVQNLISRYRAEGKDCGQLKQTANCAVLVIFGALLPLVILLGVAVKFLILDRYPDVDISTVIVFCVGLFIVGLSSLFNQILYAEQCGLWPNLYPALNTISITICLIVLLSAKTHSINMVLMVFVIANIIVACLGFVQTKVIFVWCLDKQIISEIWRDCRGFALFAFLAASVLGIDYLIMSRILSAYDIAIYNICQLVFMTLFSLHAIMLTTAWSGVSETLFAKQWDEARKRIRNLLIVGGGMIITLGGVIMLFMGKIVEIISNNKITTIPMPLTILFLVYILIRIWSDTFSMALLSFNETRIFNRYLPFQATVSIISQIVLGSKYGTSGIMFGLIISFLVTAAWILPLSFYKLTRENHCA